jgi:hypothetical protein
MGETVSYVYIITEPGLWTVGHYSPDGRWHPDSDFGNRDEARERVHWLNGGNPPTQDVFDDTVDCPLCADRFGIILGTDVTDTVVKCPGCGTSLYVERIQYLTATTNDDQYEEDEHNYRIMTKIPQTERR